MAQEDDIQTAGAARALKGLADDLATEVRNQAAVFLARAAETSDEAKIAGIDKTMRTIVAIARAGLAVQSLQAAEDKAAARAVDRRVNQAAARARTHFIQDEGDETDMNEPDPRLGTAEGVDEIYEDAQRGVDRVLRHLELKRGHPHAGGGADGAGPVDKLDHQGERGATPPH